MPAPPLDAALAHSFLARLDAIPAGRAPSWGSMSPSDVVPHLLGAVRGSMGELARLPVRSSFWRRHVIFRLLVWRIASIPKGVTLRDAKGEPVLARADGALEDLREALERFVAGAADGSLVTIPHPVFGDIGPRGWARFHTLHFEHHLEQFGV